MIEENGALEWILDKGRTNQRFQQDTHFPYYLFKCLEVPKIAKEKMQIKVHSSFSFLVHGTQTPA